MLTFYLLAVKYDGRGHKGSVLRQKMWMYIYIYLILRHIESVGLYCLSLHNNRIISGSNGVQVKVLKPSHKKTTLSQP